MGTRRAGVDRNGQDLMSVDVVDLRTFYDGALGAVAARLVGRQLDAIWPDLRGLRLLGLGYATPYMPALAAGCERVTAFMPAAQGVVHWPRPGLSASVLVDPLTLPLAEASFDRVLVVHALETAASAAELLDEVARILTPAGRAILVCPNRRGLWARMDATPFGQGQPFSRKQLRRLLRGTLLAPERWAEALYMPPIATTLVLRSASTWERCGASLSLPFAGLHVLETTKRFHRLAPARSRRRTSARQPIFAPVPAS